MRSLPSNYYTREYYFSSCRGYEEFLKGLISQRLIYAFSLADIKKETHVLDIGTGRGELAVKCAEAGAYVKAIDYSQAAIEIAKENLTTRVGKKVAERIVYERMNAKKIDYLNNYFDVVFMIDFIEHLSPPELKQVFLEIRRVTKPNGKVIIHTPNSWLIKSICFLASILFHWEPDKVHEAHVNEQNYFSLSKELLFFGRNNRVRLNPRKKYFAVPVENIKELPAWTTPVANLLDKLWENKAISFLIYYTPLAFILGTDLWAVVQIDERSGLQK